MNTKKVFKWRFQNQWFKLPETRSETFRSWSSGMKFYLVVKKVDVRKKSYLFNLWIHITKEKPFVLGKFDFRMHNVTSNTICTCKLAPFSFNNKPSDNYFISWFYTEIADLNHGFSIEVVWRGLKGPVAEIEILPVEPINLMTENFDGLLERIAFSDAVIQLEDGSRIPGHKSILCERSPVFCDLFKRVILEYRSSWVTITDISPDAVRNMVRYLYFDSLPEFTYESAKELLKAAASYKIPDLEKICARYLLKQLNACNALDLLLLADEYNDINTVTNVILYIADNRKLFSDINSFKTLQDRPNLLTGVLFAVMNK